MKKKIIMALIISALLILMLPTTVYAQQPLDEILDYTICVDMRNDGTMDIKYHFEWKVLDSTSEGPLSWVDIGIPNEHCDELTALTDNIKTIDYHSEWKNGELLTFARIDFDREYEAGEVIIFEFSLHQTHMYVIEEQSHRLRYSFTAGWFDEIQVKQLTIKWDADNILEMSGEPVKNGEYYVWTDTLDYTERFNITIYYNLDVFDATEEGQYKEPEKDNGALVFFIIVVVVVLVVIMIIISDDGYDSGSGFSGSRHYHHTHVHSHRSSCACVSRCACACACAGGGRAGCSAKDFYASNSVKTDGMLKVLQEE